MPIPRPLDRSDSASWSHGGFHDLPASTCPCLRGDPAISREHGHAQVKQGLSVPCRVLNMAMAKPLLDCPRVVSIVGQLKAAGVAQHVRVYRAGELGTSDRPPLATSDAGRLR